MSVADTVWKKERAAGQRDTLLPELGDVTAPDSGPRSQTLAGGDQCPDII